MRIQKIGIVGYGVVGRVHKNAFDTAGIETVIYDKFDPTYSGRAQGIAVNSCDLVFIAVPTPASPKGACDVSAVEEVVRWVAPPMCIKSTVAPGTTNRLIHETGKQIVFSPEYTGETPFHRHRANLSNDVVAVGGQRDLAEAVVGLYTRVLGPQPVYLITDAVTAELAKYMENCFFATKVAFVGQFFLLAKAFGADFTLMREIWTADGRVGRSHSSVIDTPGFDGKCLPKDLSAIVAAAKAFGCRAELLEAVESFNKQLRDWAP